MSTKYGLKVLCIDDSNIDPVFCIPDGPIVQGEIYHALRIIQGNRGGCAYIISGKPGSINGMEAGWNVARFRILSRTVTFRNAAAGQEPRNAGRHVHSLEISAFATSNTALPEHNNAISNHAGWTQTLLKQSKG